MATLDKPLGLRLDQFGREDRRVGDWHYLIVIAMQDQGPDVELLEVVREIGFRPGLDPQVRGGKAGHAALDPKGFAQAF